MGINENENVVMSFPVILLVRPIFTCVLTGMTTAASENLERAYSAGNHEFHEDSDTNLNPKSPTPANKSHLDITADYVTRVAYNLGSGTGNLLKEIHIIVVLPSIDFDEVELQRINKVVGFYEERQLYHLFLLQDPSYRVVYLSSHPISEEIIRYYVSLNCTYEDEIDERLSRLSLLTIGNHDPIYKSLSIKVHQSREFIPLIAHEIQHFMCATETRCKTGLSVFTGSQSADQLARLLDLRLLEADADRIYFGTKQGSRELFKACGIKYPPGTPDMDLGDGDLLTTAATGNGCMAHLHFIRTPESLAKGIARQILQKNVKPNLWVVKLNQGFSGKGNAFIDLKNVQSKIFDTKNMDDCIKIMSDEILLRLPDLEFVCRKMSWDGDDDHIGFKEQMYRLGVIAEAYLDDPIASPSVQAVIDPTVPDIHSKVQVLSTHEQILNGQVFEGCKNPASDSYRTILVDYTRSIGYKLIDEGVIGHFGVDYLVTSDSSSAVEITGIEINLRQGGTTHPFSTMALLCGGAVDRQGIFRTIDGQRRYYVATDNYHDEGLKCITISHFLCHLQEEAALLHVTRWDLHRKIGVVFHMLGFIPHGKLGFTAIGSSSSEAQQLYNETMIFLGRIVNVARLATISLLDKI